MAETKNYAFQKPSQDDFYDIDEYNKALDAIDEEIKRTNDKADNLSDEIEKLCYIHVGDYRIEEQVEGASVKLTVSVSKSGAYPAVDGWRLYADGHDISGKIEMDGSFTTAPAIFGGDDVAVAFEYGGDELFRTNIMPGENGSGKLCLAMPAANKYHREAEVLDHPDGSVTLAKLADDVLGAMLSAEYDADHKRLVLTGGGGSGGGGGSASLPIATADVLGGIKIGAGIDMDDDGTANVKPDVRADEIMTAEEAAEIINRVFSEEGLS